MKAKSRLFEASKYDSPLAAILDACYLGQTDFLQALIDAKKIDAHFVNNCPDKSPLFAAVSGFLNDTMSKKQKEVIEILLKLGADPYKADTNCYSPAYKIFRQSKCFIRSYCF